MEIRPVQYNQAEILAPFARALFYDAYKDSTDGEDMGVYLDNAFNLSKVQKEISNPKIQYFFACQNDELIGYLKLRWDRNDEKLEDFNPIELQRIYLKREYWGKQLGSELLNFSFNYAIESGFDCLWLLIYRENKKAMRFYQKHGMEIFGERYFLFGNTQHLDWVLLKDLRNYNSI